MDDITEIIASFRELKRAYYRLVQLDAEAVGVTTLQLMVMRKLSQHESLTLSELAEGMQLTPSTMSGVVDRLAKAGLIERDRSTQDRRALVLHLTEAGRGKLEIAFGPQSTIYRRLTGENRLSEQDTQELLRLHQAYIKLLTIEEGEPEQ
ncbi:MarR family winged helix-turn-helix transcriptional regulator [Tumebacillus permanentifrigoris]|uniref:DNA-binding MarR family transcriptional regulator n=1 Tax=Tumebacillus permanentifrigoris TaxID=378543 RepID=A0A316D659_9BACL|nr:MarR family transcriptional regulator [Tumebacillus permanentifrigoris]PWK09594.1 DNA-binding MarR family transcriptional regulator [Tumebacillus permanentifrigoris]